MIDEKGLRLVRIQSDAPPYDVPIMSEQIIC